MPKRPLSGDHTLAWISTRTKWEEDTDSDEEQGSEWDDLFWDEEGTWLFWRGDWWLQEESGWWRKWVDEQQPTADQNSDEHQRINDSPKQEENIEDLVNGMVQTGFEQL